MQFDQLKRREFMTLLGGAAVAWPIAARAQQAGQMRRIGLLMALAEDDPQGKTRIAALRQALENLGWTEGRNLRIEYRWTAGDPERARVYAAELVVLKPDVIFAAPTSIAAAVQRETRSVPVVFAQVADPVGAGLVASLARPGGNITGFAHFEFPIGAKWLELLKQIAPNVTRVAVIYDPTNPASTGYLPLMEAAARALGVHIYPTAVRDAAAIERTIDAFAREPNGGLIMIPGPIMGVQRELIIAFANRHRLPNVYAFRFHPVGGGLASYGVDLIDLYRRAASYVDRILRGEKPAELPVQHATKFELVINLKTARLLGLTVPPTLLATADEVIE
jgi:putative tryptophan/tyrosine transport system substrate-binding protein